MEWIAALGNIWLTTLAWLVSLAVAFGVLVRFMPCNDGMYWWKDLRAVSTDFFYWFVVPLFLRVCRMVMLVAGLLLLFGGRDPHVPFISHLPLWLQCVAVLVIQDVMLYWLHRVFHSRLGWKFHAVHHSPTTLDWMSTARFHPINNLLTFCLADIAVLLMGFSPATLVLLAPFNIIYSAMVHANLNWTFGPFRYLFASPVFHRWHHTTQEEGLDKNFASTFPVLDLVFGTYYMPPGKLPEQFGVGEPDFPEGFLGQFLYPFLNADPNSVGPVGWALQWTRRRPGLALTAGCVLTVATVLGGMHALTWLAEQHEQETREMARLQWEQGQTFAGVHSVPSDPERATPILSIASSSGSPTLVTGSQDGLVKVWDAQGHEKFALKGHTRAVKSVAVSSDGKRIVSGSQDKTVKVWDAETAQERLTLKGHKSFVLSVAVSGDGSRVLSAGADGIVKVWDAESGNEKLTLATDGPVIGAAMSDDGKLIVAATGWVVHAWDGETGKEKFTLTGHKNLVYTVAITPDGKQIVSGSFDEKVKVWDAETGQEKCTLSGHTDPVYSVAIRRDGKQVVSGSKDKTVKVWDLDTGHERFTLQGHTDSVNSVAIRAEDGWVLSASQDGTMKLWNMRGYHQGKEAVAASSRPQPLVP